MYSTGQRYIATGVPLLVKHDPGLPARTLFVDFVYQPIVEADGTISGIFVEGSDITDRKEVEEKLRDADQRKDEFLAMLAHELRNPLAPISTAAQALAIRVIEPIVAPRAHTLQDYDCGSFGKLTARRSARPAVVAVDRWSVHP